MINLYKQIRMHIDYLFALCDSHIDMYDTNKMIIFIITKMSQKYVILS